MVNKHLYFSTIMITIIHLQYLINEISTLYTNDYACDLSMCRFQCWEVSMLDVMVWCGCEVVSCYRDCQSPLCWHGSLLRKESECLLWLHITQHTPSKYISKIKVFKFLSTLCEWTGFLNGQGMWNWRRVFWLINSIWAGWLLTKGGRLKKCWERVKKCEYNSGLLCSIVII